MGPCGAIDRPDHGDGVGPLEGQRDERPRGDEVDERHEERSFGVDGVVLLGELARYPDELEADDLEAALFVPGEDAADEQALDAVGLDEDEGAFGHGRSCSDWAWRGLGAGRWP